MQKMPVFIKVENYEDVLDVVNMLKEKMGKIKTTFATIEQIKAEEDAKIKEWKMNIEDIDAKINNIDQVLFEPQ